MSSKSRICAIILMDHRFEGIISETCLTIMRIPNKQPIDILIICEDIDYDRSSGGLVNTKIISWLAQHYRIHLASMSTEPQGFSRVFTQTHDRVKESASGFWELFGTIPGLRSLPERFTGINHRMLARYFGWRRYLHNEVAGLSPKIILALSAGMGWYTHQALLSLPKGNETRVFAFHDPFPMALLPGANREGLNRKSQQILLRRMNKVVAQADAVWLPSKRLEEWLRPFYPHLAGKAVLLPHLAIIPAELQQVTSDLPRIDGVIKPGKFNLLHMGSLLQGRSPQGFLSAALAWLGQDKQRQNDTNISFVGKIWNGYNALFSSLNNHPSFNIHTGTRVPYQTALHWQKSASVNLVIEIEQDDSPQLLGKMADVVWAAQPIMLLGSERSEARRLVGEKYPYQAENGEVEKIQAMLDDLYENWKLSARRLPILDPIRNTMDGKDMLTAIEQLLAFP